MVMQTILLREFFVVAAGNEISFGIAMAGWLLGVGAGSLVGAFFSRKRKSTAAVFSWAALAMCLVAPLLLAATRSLHLFGGHAPGSAAAPGQDLLPDPAARPALQRFERLCLSAGRQACARPAEKAAGAMTGAYAWEALGAMAGGLAYTFWLVEQLDPLTIIVLFALPLLLGAGLVSRQAPQNSAGVGALLAALLLLAVLISGGTGRCESWLVAQRWQGISAGTLVAVRDTRYQNLQLGLADGQYSLFTNGQLAAVFPDDSNDDVLAAQILPSIRARAHPGDRRRLRRAGQAPSALPDSRAHRR